jgi:hypothetical protein
VDSIATLVTPHTRPQAGRNHPQQVVAIDRNGWSRSIVAPGRDHPLRAGLAIERLQFVQKADQVLQTQRAKNKTPAW